MLYIRLYIIEISVFQQSDYDAQWSIGLMNKDLKASNYVL